MRGWWPWPLVAAVDSLNRRGGAIAVRLVKFTGKSPDAIHPKHLVDVPWHHWYVDYLKPEDVVLDLGCANGTHTLAVAGRTRRVCALVVTIIVVRSFSFAIAAAIALISSAVFTVGGSMTRIASAGTPS